MSAKRPKSLVFVKFTWNSKFLFLLLWKKELNTRHKLLFANPLLLFKHRLFDLTQLIVWNYKGLRHQVAKIKGLEQQKYVELKMFNVRSNPFWITSKDDIFTIFMMRKIFNFKLKHDYLNKHHAIFVFYGILGF